MAFRFSAELTEPLDDCAQINALQGLNTALVTCISTLLLSFFAVKALIVVRGDALLLQSLELIDAKTTLKRRSHPLESDLRTLSPLP